MDHGIPTHTSSFERVWGPARRWIFVSWTRTRGNGYNRRINQLLAHAFAYGAKKKGSVYLYASIPYPSGGYVTFINRDGFLIATMIYDPENARDLSDLFLYLGL